MEAQPLRANSKAYRLPRGPGSGEARKRRDIREIISGCSVPLVMDADGINALEGHIDLLKSARCLSF